MTFKADMCCCGMAPRRPIQSPSKKVNHTVDHTHTSSHGWVMETHFPNESNTKQKPFKALAKGAKNMFKKAVSKIKEIFN